MGRRSKVARRTKFAVLGLIRVTLPVVEAALTRHGSMRPDFGRLHREFSPQSRHK